MDRRNIWSAGGRGPKGILAGTLAALPNNAAIGSQYFVTPTLTATCASGQTQPIVMTYTGSVWAANQTVIFRQTANQTINGALQRSLLRGNVTVTGTRANSVLAPNIFGATMVGSNGKCLQVYMPVIRYSATGAGTTFTWRLKYGTATIVSAVSVPGTATGFGEILMTMIPRAGSNAQLGQFRQLRFGSTVSQNQALAGLITTTTSQVFDVTVQPNGVTSAVSVRYLSVVWTP